MELGKEPGSIALDYGDLRLVDIYRVPDNTMIVTTSVVGASAVIDKHVKP